MAGARFGVFDRVKEATTPVVHRVMSWPNLEPAFLVLLIAFLSLLLSQTFSYRADTRLLPLLIGVPTLLLLVFLLVTSLRGDAKDVDGSILDTVIELEELPDAVPSDDENMDEPSLVEERIQIGIAFLWIVGFLALVFVVGILPGIAMFMVLFNRYQFDFDLKTNVIYTAVVWIVIFAIFSELLNVRFYTGLFL